MKVTGEMSMVSGAAAFVARYAAKAGAGQPALTGVRIEARDDRVLLRSYDHEAAGSVELPIRPDEPGTVLVPGTMFAEILRTLPSGEIQLSDRDGTVEITGGDERTGDIRFDLPMLPTSEQPDPPETPVRCGSVAADEFARAVRRAGRLAARDDLVPVLTGTLLRLSPERLTVAACDRYRVGICELDWSEPPELPDPADAEHDVVVPARLLTDTAAGLLPHGSLELGLLGDERAPVVLGIRSAADDQVRSAVLRLLDGRFPPLRPKNAATETTNLGTVTVDAEELRAALDRVCLVADRLTAVVLTIESGRLTVRASGSASAVGRQAMPADLEGSGTVTAYNASYLRDGLEFVAGDQVRLAFNEGTRTASLLSSPERPGYRYVVMPRRIPD